MRVADAVRPGGRIGLRGGGGGAVGVAGGGDAVDTGTQPCAIVELGSNSFHLIVVRTLQTTGCVQVMDRMRERVRLGLGVDAAGHVAEPFRSRALDCLARFGERLRGIDARRVRAVGTHAMRLIREPQFLAAMAERLGCEVVVLGGREEAELVYRGVASGEPHTRRDRLLLDLGGGSTECVLERDRELLVAESVGVGCVSATSRFFGSGRIHKRAFKKASQWAARAFEDLVKRHSVLREEGGEGVAEVLGSSGTINAIARVLAEDGGQLGSARAADRDGAGGSVPLAGRISRDGLEALRAHLIDVEHVEQLTFRSVDSERLAVLAGGVAVLLGAMDALEIEEVRAVPMGIREGLLTDLLDDLAEEDLHPNTRASRHVLRQVGQRFHVDAEQADRVATTAIALRAAIAGGGGGDHPKWQLGGDAAFRVLFGAAWLHEVGLSLAHSGHHRHAEYLIRHTALPGFRAADRESIAQLVRFHRRKLSGAEFAPHPELAPEVMLRLCCILRLAVILNRSRSLPAENGAARLAKLDALGDKLTLELGSEHRTAMLDHDLEQETSWLRAVGLRLRVTSERRPVS